MMFKTTIAYGKTGDPRKIKCPCRDTGHNLSFQTCPQTFKCPQPSTSKNCAFFVYTRLPPSLRGLLSRPHKLLIRLHDLAPVFIRHSVVPLAVQELRRLSTCAFPSRIPHCSFKNQDDLQVS